MVLYLIRGAYVLLTAVIASFYLLSFQAEGGASAERTVTILVAAVLTSTGVILIDIAFRHKKLAAVSGLFLGLVTGLVAAYALSFVVDLFEVISKPPISVVKPEITPNDLAYFALNDTQREHVDGLYEKWQEQKSAQIAYSNVLQGVKVLLGLLCVYIFTTLVIQTKDDFRFILPYIEFTRQSRGTRPVLLDTSILIDGRILDILPTRVMQTTLIVPNFVIHELQQLADSSDKLKRGRGRRGLDSLRKLQDNTYTDVRIQDPPQGIEGEGVDQKLVHMAKDTSAQLMTTDFNLLKVAAINNIDTINLNDLARALQAQAIPGESLQIHLVRAGENADQAVGYLPDGTMVVVENGRTAIGQTVLAMVTSSIQTSAGRMIFARNDTVDESKT